MSNLIEEMNKEIRSLFDALKSLVIIDEGVIIVLERIEDLGQQKEYIELRASCSKDEYYSNFIYTHDEEEEAPLCEFCEDRGTPVYDDEGDIEYYRHGCIACQEHL